MLERFLRTERETVLLRLVAALGAATALYTRQESLSLVSSLVAPLVYAAYVAYALVFRRLAAHSGAHSLVFVATMVAADVAAILGIVVATGTLTTSIMVLFPVFIIYYSIHLGYLGSFLTATASTVGLASYVVIGGGGDVVERDLLVAIAMFYIAAMISGYLGQKGIQNEAEKRELQELLAVEIGARSLLQAAQRLATRLDTNALFQHLVQVAPGITGAAYCAALLNDRTGDLVCVAANLPAASLGLSSIVKLVDPLEDGSLGEQAVQERKPVSVIAAHGGWLKLFPDPLVAQSRRVLAIPLLEGETLLGMMYCFDLSEEPFTEKDLAMATGLGELATVAVSNARRHEETEERVQMLAEELADALQHLERRPDAGVARLMVDELCIDVPTRVVTLSGQPLDLSPTEFRVLKALAERAGTPVTEHELFREAWGDVYKGDTNIVEVYIHRLRKKLEEDAASPTRILTVRGAGYKMAHGS